MKKFTKFFALTLTGAMLLSLCAACGGAASGTDGNDDGKKKTTLVLGTSADYAPFENMVLNSDLTDATYNDITLKNSDQDSYFGIDIAMAKAIAADMGLELQVVNMEFGNLTTALSKGEVDMVIAAMEKDGERDKVVDFSDPYYTDLPPMILVKKDNVSAYASLSDFDGKAVGAQSGTTKYKIIEEQMTGAQPTALGSVTDLVNNLVYDKLDAIVLDGAVAVKYAETNDQLAVVEAISLGDAAEPYRVAVQKGDPNGLLESINKTVAKVTEEKSVANWYELSDALSTKAMNG